MNHLLRQGYKVARVAITIGDDGYCVTCTLRAEGVEDEIVVADRLTYDEMLGCVARAALPLGVQYPNVPFGRHVPREAARAMKETGRA